MGTATIFWAVSAIAAIGSAILFTQRFNSKESPARKRLKFLGILISTLPILGIIQGVIALRRSAPGYASSCSCQAAVGGIIYIVGKHVPGLFFSA